MFACKTIGCNNHSEIPQDFCPSCTEKYDPLPENASMSQRYPKYFKDVSELDEIDVYQVHQLFNVTDPSGCIHHASKKLLLGGERTGGKSRFKDIKEARDTLNRWLQINAHLEAA